MSSFAKLLVRPRLQLVVLMLVLGAALLPKNSMAEDEAPVSPDAGASPGTDEAPAASGRAEGGPPPPDMKDVECWDCSYADEHCRKPTKPAAKVKTCKGYCYQDIKDDGTARRRCAGAAEMTCLKDQPEQCEKYKPGEKAPTASCMEEEGKKNMEPPTAAPTTKGRSGAGPEGGMRCICDKNLCNDKSSGPIGVKQLGYGAALVGALLVAAFPLRTLFLVG